MLVLRNVRIVLLNVRKKLNEPPNVTKIQSHVMLVLHNVRMVPSNVRKNKGTTECDKSTVTCDISTSQYENDTIKCEKTIREPLNVKKVQSHVILVLHNVKKVSLNVKKIREPPNITKV